MFWRNDAIKLLKNKEQLGPHASHLMKIGGEWLGKVRSWIQWNCVNGDRVDWGSDEFLQMKPMTVKDLEYFAAEIAIATLHEFKEHLVTEEQKHALRAYANPNNWCPDESGNCKVFMPDREKMHWQFYACPLNHGWELAEWEFHVVST